MNFQHTETRQMLADSLRRFLAERYTADIRRQAVNAPGHSRTTWDQLVDLGVVNALFDEADGGFGGEGFDIMVVFEALGAGLVAEPMLSALLAGRALALGGHPFRDSVVAGETIVAFAHQEAGARYNANHVETRARKTDGGWILNGAKAVVADAEAASHLLISARTQGEIMDRDGISLFAIPVTAAGVNLRAYPLIDGGRAAEISLQDVRVEAVALVGAENHGFPIIESVIGLGVLALCAEGLGIMDALKTATLDYLRTRIQFGTPIGANQALQHRMANLLIDIEQARSSVINAAAAVGGNGTDRERALAAAKYTVGVTGTRVAEEAIQMHGGIGMTQDLAAAQSAKRLMMIDHQLGDSDHHLERYVSLGRAA
jgi:alkylation response protein AidB-like acyl-CoA dehydrogenase